MNAEVLFQAIEAAAVVVGVAFAVYETRRYRGEQNREAAMELLHAFNARSSRKLSCSSTGCLMVCRNSRSRAVLARTSIAYMQ